MPIDSTRNRVEHAVAPAPGPPHRRPSAAGARSERMDGTRQSQPENDPLAVYRRQGTDKTAPSLPVNWLLTW